MLSEYRRWDNVRDPSAPAESELRDVTISWLNESRLLSLRRIPKTGEERLLIHEAVTADQASAWQDAILGGYFPAEGRRIDQVVEGQRAFLRPGAEQMHGVHCVVVEADSGNARYSVWFAPDRGGSVLRMIKVQGRVASTRRTIDGVEEDRPTARRIVRVTQELFDVQARRFGAHWIPVKARYTEEVLYDEGPPSRITKTIERSEIELAPQVSDRLFAAEIPNGTRIDFVNGRTGIPYEWRDGKAMPREDQQVTERLNSLGAGKRFVRGDDVHPGQLLVGPILFLTPIFLVWLLLHSRFVRRSFVGSTVMLGMASPSFAQDPLCGVHAIYTGSMLLDAQPPFGDLLKPEFVGAIEGSSIAELQSAVEKIGLHSLALGNLTGDDLRSSKSPVILHVRTDFSAHKYNHFVLFGGMHEKKLVIFDGVKGVKQWSAAELASRWDGNALVISRENIGLSDIAIPSRIRFGSWLIVIVLGVGLLGAIARPSAEARWFIHGTLQTALLLLLTVFASWIFHSSSASGFIAGSEAVRAVQAANAATWLPRIDFATAREFFEQQSTSFVDASARENFRDGHIPGAVNVPANISEEEAVRIAATLPSRRRIVVYCSSHTCPYSTITAQRLLDLGHTNVVVYPGGWNEWKSRVGKPTP
jgi:rhodanese-related sulfurtransferase